MPEDGCELITLTDAYAPARHAALCLQIIAEEVY